LKSKPLIISDKQIKYMLLVETKSLGFVLGFYSDFDSAEKKISKLYANHKIDENIDEYLKKNLNYISLYSIFSANPIPAYDMIGNHVFGTNNGYFSLSILEVKKKFNLPLFLSLRENFQIALPYCCEDKRFDNMDKRGIEMYFWMAN